MSNFDSMSRRDASRGDGVADAPPTFRLNDIFRAGIKTKTDTPAVPAKTPTAVERADEFALSHMKSVSQMFDSFFKYKRGLLFILGVMSVGVAAQLTLTTRVLDNDLLNTLLGVATGAGMIFGLFMADKITDGLRVGAFVGVSKIVAFFALLLIAFEEVQTMMAKVDPASAHFYILYVGPICLATYGLIAVILGLMKPDEMQARKIRAVRMRTERNKALREIREPERKEKALAKADAMGTFAEKMARLKVVVIASIVSVVAGWGDAWGQAVALAEAKRKETGKHIEGYSGAKRKNGAGGKPAKK